MSFYDTLDHVIDVMYRELHEEKRKNHDKEKMRGRHDDVKKIGRLQQMKLFIAIVAL